MRQLYREVGLTAAAALVVGNIIGTGIFTTTGLIAQDLGASPWLLGIWVAGGALALAGAYCYARLGSLHPRAGGEYAFLLPAFGTLPAFLSGWTSLFIGFTAPLAACALGLAHYLLPLFLSSDATPWFLRLSAAGVLWVVGGLLSAGLRTGNRLQSWFSCINVVVIVAFVAAVLLRGGNGSLAAALAGPFLPEPLGALGSSFILVMFTYSGWNAAAYLAEEIPRPEYNLPRALLLGTGVVTILYLAMNCAYLAAVPLERLLGEIAVARLAADQALGARAGVLVNLIIIISLLSSLSAMSIAGPRVYFAMARDGLFPRWLADVDPARKVPLRAIWFQIVIATIFTQVGTLYQILLYSGFVLLFFSTLTVATLFRLPTGRVLPGLFVVANAAIMIAAAWRHPREAAVGILTVLAGLPVYWYYRRRRMSLPGA